jgi:CelD/BcsL family acetyltransferase involved in cellulose biosynthesis
MSLRSEVVEAGMRVDRIPIDDARWWEFVSSHPEAGPFHLPAWATLIADCYRFQPFALVILGGDGEVLAGMPCLEVRNLLGAPKWVSLSFSDSCPPLLRDGVDASDVMGTLTEYVLSSGVRELEVRSDLPPAADCHSVEVGYIHHIDLPSDPRDLHVRRNHRNLSNRAQRRGVRVARGNSPEDLATFYRLHTLTRRRLGVPVQPRRFFDLVGERMLARGNGFVATATLDGEVVSAAVYLSFNGTLVSKYHATGPAPSAVGEGHLTDWEIISAACAEGYHTLDLGRTDLGSDGLRLYKAGWGAVEEPLVYTHISDRAPKAERIAVGGLARRVISTSPPFVCRALGEVLYRWTA